MSAPTTIPMEIEPPAAQLVTELGMRAEFEQILEHLRQHVDGLVNLKVQHEGGPGTEDQPSAWILGAVDRSLTSGHQTSAQLNDWKEATYPPAVCERIFIFLYYLR